jgi:hypothetical protein
LIIHDEKDEEAPYRYAQQIHAAWAASRLITTSGLGHNLKSAQVVGKVKDFLSSKDAKGFLISQDEKELRM